MIHMSDQAGGLRQMRDAHHRGETGHGGFAPGTLTLAVTSGKGGVGKTQVSANLAVALARQGYSVLLLDADLGLASLDLALGLSPTSDLMSVVRGKARLSDILTEGPAGVKLLPACPGRYDMANMSDASRHRLTGALRELATSFDVLIIDTGAGLGSNAVEFAALADEVLLVATPDPTSLRDAYAMAKVLHRRNGVARVQFVANQVKSEWEGTEIFERLESIVTQFLELELSFLGAVPSDPAVGRAVASGEPFMLGSPRSAPARAVEALTRRLGMAAAKEVLC